jgi:hypothetical protein
LLASEYWSALDGSSSCSDEDICPEIFTVRQQVSSKAFNVYIDKRYYNKFEEKGENTKLSDYHHVLS